MQVFDNLQRRLMLDLARNAIRSHVQSDQGIAVPSEDFLMNPSGVFVTLRILDDLRGCIGSVEPRFPLGAAIVKSAIGAAFQDPRFPPLTRGEYDKIRLEISVLSALRPLGSIDEIEIGTHGIFLSFGYCRGLLLPQVAKEHEWDRNTFLKYTCRKAGLPDDAWQNPQARIEVFSAEVFCEDRP